VLPEPPGTVVQEKDRQNVDPEKGENDNASVVESELGVNLHRRRNSAQMRDFILYIVFVVVFSLAAFFGRPGPIQQILTGIHTQGFSNLGNINTFEDVYGWITGTYGPQVFPTVDQAAASSDPSAPTAYLGMPDRLYVSGHSRVLSALRIRQVRSDEITCKVIGFMKDVAGYPITCLGSYGSHASTTDIYDSKSSDYAALGDFTLPFTYQTAEELDSSHILKLKGVYGKYKQDGYNLDVVPNVSPRLLAQQFQACEDFYQQSIDKCAEQQGYAAVPANKTHDGQAGCPSDARPITQLAYNIGLDLSKCKRLPNPPASCKLKYVPLDMAQQYMQPSKCGNCTCASDDDATCNQNCSPLGLMTDQVNLLQSNSWLSEDTRALIVDTALFDQESNLFSSIRQLLEFPPVGAGNVEASLVSVNTVRLFQYVTKGDMAVLGLEVVVMVFVLYYTVVELIEMRNKGFKNFRELWNWVDWANLALLYAVIILRGLSWKVIRDSNFSSLQVTYVDFPTLVDWSNNEVNLIAFNFFLIYFKIFKYLSHVPRMDAILVTVSSCAFDLALFMVMAVIFLLGFVASFTYCFGPYLSDYATAGATLSMLMRMLLGDFNYPELQGANPIMAPILFYLYICYIFFILLNMFLAIINDSYAEVKANQTEEDLLYYVRLKNTLVERLNILLGRKRAINKLAKDLMRDVEDDKVTMDELRTMLRENPQALHVLETTTVEELMAKYDINNDGSLSRAEVREIIKELALKEAAVQARIDDAQEHGGMARPTTAHRRARGMTGVGDMGMSGAAMESIEERLGGLDEAVKDLSRNVAKKMALMIELMMSLSEQVGR